MVYYNDVNMHLVAKVILEYISTKELHTYHFDLYTANS